MTNFLQRDLFGAPMVPIPKRLVLEIKGPIPSFKNNKMLLTKDRRGRPLPKPLIITKPEYQKRLAEMVDGIVSQLRCAFQTASGQTLTGSSLRFAIAWCVPEDDCWTYLPEIQIRGELCPPGQEGATVVLERLE